MTNTQKSLITPLFYPTIVISDLHLGKGSVVEAELLVEFLENMDCETLILNGDVIDGWYLEKKKHKNFPEMHARVLDIINYKAAHGTRVIYIPGNHDERLRYKSREEMEQKRMDRAKPNFAELIDFKHKSKKTGRIVSCPIEFLSDMVYRDKAKRKLRVLHGDIFDPPWVTGSLSILGDRGYDAAIEANAVFSALFKRFNSGTRFSIAKFLKSKTKHMVGIIANFETAARDLPKGIDGMVCGHIHHAEVTDKDGKLYINSGDWVESCTAAVNDEYGNWDIIHWEEMRLKLGLNKKISAKKKAKLHKEKYKDYRKITKKQLRIAQYFWPAKNRTKLLKKVVTGKMKPKELKLEPA
ncbi:MAG: UDP-2,3-diacylglucosamine diphosphatase [Alphaproteobacteria bacterium]|nr:UDP-2,3-diacylglucosamine diphosphatase [Alphaproteobacteria bacterium]